MESGVDRSPAPNNHSSSKFRGAVNVRAPFDERLEPCELWVERWLTGNGCWPPGACRFARHTTFLYLIYDVLIRRQSAIGHSVLMKKASWETARERIGCLSQEVLLNCARALEEHQRLENDDVSTLLNGVKSIGSLVPNSHQQRSRMRVEMKSMVVRYGVPAIWFTLNPSDLRNPLVLRLSGVDTPSVGGWRLSQFCSVTATLNPGAVAEYFHEVISCFFRVLVAPGAEGGGIFGHAETYYGAVETNGRGMHHLHGLIWLKGNMEFPRLRDHLRESPTYAERVISYLESIISECVEPVSPTSNPDGSKTVARTETGGTGEMTSPLDDPTNHQRTGDECRSQCLSELPPDLGNDVPDNGGDDQRIPANSSNWLAKLIADANAVARSKQMHSPNHTATCFKYRRGKAGCRFNKPEALRESSRVDENGVVSLRRNNVWVNSWNVAISSCLRSNHDVSFIATQAKMLSLIHYVTNYATKMEAPIHHALVVAAAVSKQQSIRLEPGEPNSLTKSTLHGCNRIGPPAKQVQAVPCKNSKFLLQCFNKINSEREISGVQAAATLKGYPENYTQDRFANVQLGGLGRTIAELLSPFVALTEVVEMGTEDTEPCVSIVSPRSIGVGPFDDYQFRGERFRDLCLYDYKSTVVRRLKSAGGGGEGIDFADAHPLKKTHSQRILHRVTDHLTVKFTGRMFSSRDGLEESEWYVRSTSSPFH